MPGHIGFAVRERPAWVAVAVIARVPARRTDINAAAYREMIVKHRDLLMMAAPQRMRAVEAKTDRAGDFPAQDHREDARHREMLESAEIPAKNIDVAPGLAVRQSQQEVAQRLALAPIVGFQGDTRIKIPANEENAFLRSLHQSFEQRIIIGGIDDHPRLVGTRDAPAIAPFYDDRGQLTGTFMRAHRHRHAWRRRWLHGRASGGVELLGRQRHHRLAARFDLAAQRTGVGHETFGEMARGDQLRFEE